MLLFIVVVLCAWGIPLARYDFREHRLPDVLTLPAYPVSLSLVAFLHPGNLGVAAATGVGAVLLGITLFYIADVGLGDAKLLGVTGVLAGLSTHPGVAFARALVVAACVGGIHAIVHVCVTRDRHGAIPFGPAILFGTLAMAISG